MQQVYLKESFIVSSLLFLFIHNMTLLQGLFAIGVESKNACCPHSQKPRVLISTLVSFELFDVLHCSFTPDNGVNLGLINHYVVCI